MTERVTSCNLRIFPKFATACALSGSLIARQLSHRGSQGRLRRRIPADLPSALGGYAPAAGFALTFPLRRQCTAEMSHKNACRLYGRHIF